jgi:hypothetical protein
MTDRIYVQSWGTAETDWALIIPMQMDLALDIGAGLKAAASIQNNSGPPQGPAVGPVVG